MKTKKFRTKLLIYPQFQITLLVINTIVTVCIFLIVGIQASRSYELLRELGVRASYPADHMYFRFVNLQAKTLYTNLSIALVIGIVVSSVVSLYLSHRLAGPIVRLRGYFREIGESGKVQNLLFFRKNDFFADLPGDINKAISRLTDKNVSS